MSKKKGFLPAKAIGKRIAVRFHDHSIYDSSKTTCEITGIVEKWSEKEVIIRWWSTFDGEAEVPVIEDQNNEVARVIQGTIIKWGLCEPKKWESVE